MRLSSDTRRDLGFEQPCTTYVSILHVLSIQLVPSNILIGSEAKQGIAALVPNRSLTFTTIIGSPVAAGAAVFSFSFFGALPPASSPNFLSATSSSSSLLPPPSRDRCLGSCSLYPLSNLPSSRSLPSSSYRPFFFHLNPPVDFRGRSSRLRRGDLLLCRSRRGGEDERGGPLRAEWLLGRSSRRSDSCFLRV